MGWIANCFLLVGMYAMSTQRAWPNLLLVVGDALWTVYGVMLGQYDIAVICAVFTVLAWRTYWIWRRKEKEVGSGS